MTISFEGAAGAVTGSKHLIETNGFRLLLDCGMYQGQKDEARRINSTVPFDAKSINAVILSHAHADHSGLLPLLVKGGFSGKIYATPATMEIARYILEDAANIQELDAEHINNYQTAGQNPVSPLYTKDDVEKVLPHFVSVAYFRASGQWTSITENIRFKFYDAGHILGSAVTVLEITENGEVKTVAFTGDLGQSAVPILHAPEFPNEQVGTLLLECTYGGQLHRPLEDVTATLAEVIKRALQEGGKVIVPAFALGRTQEFIYQLHKLTDEGKLPRIPVYVDSPLGVNITEVFSRYRNDFNDQTWKDFKDPNDWPLFFRNLKYIRSREDSKAMNSAKGPYMVIASSGMMEGGRIIYHLEHGISDPKNSILITGYQAEHTLGRHIQEGRPEVTILGIKMPVRAKIYNLTEFSAHADSQGLLDYVSHLAGLKKVFLVHTEPGRAQIFEEQLKTKYPNLQIDIPKLADSATL